MAIFLQLKKILILVIYWHSYLQDLKNSSNTVELWLWSSARKHISIIGHTSRYIFIKREDMCVYRMLVSF